MFRDSAQIIDDAGMSNPRADPARSSAEPSTLSLLGLVRHMAEVESVWFREGWRRTTRRRTSAPRPSQTVTSTEQCPTPGLSRRPGTCGAPRSRSRIGSAEAPDLDVTGHDQRHGEFSLREVLVHMVEEYARHNGHADLLRERIDGRIGQ